MSDGRLFVAIELAAKALTDDEEWGTWLFRYGQSLTDTQLAAALSILTREKHYRK